MLEEYEDEKGQICEKILCLKLTSKRVCNSGIWARNKGIMCGSLANNIITVWWKSKMGM